MLYHVLRSKLLREGCLLACRGLNMWNRSRSGGPRAKPLSAYKPSAPSSIKRHDSVCVHRGESVTSSPGEKCYRHDEFQTRQSITLNYLNRSQYIISRHPRKLIGIVVTIWLVVPYAKSPKSWPAYVWSSPTQNHMNSRQNVISRHPRNIIRIVSRTWLVVNDAKSYESWPGCH